MCVCVFVHLVSLEFRLWSNMYFPFPALLANDNLIHPGESCGGVEGGSRGKEDEIGKEWKEMRGKATLHLGLLELFELIYNDPGPWLH